MLSQHFISDYGDVAMLSQHFLVVKRKDTFCFFLFYFGDPPVPPYDHPAAWVVCRGEEMADFKGKGTAAPVF